MESLIPPQQWKKFEHPATDRRRYAIPGHPYEGKTHRHCWRPSNFRDPRLEQTPPSKRSTGQPEPTALRNLARSSQKFRAGPCPPKSPLETRADLFASVRRPLREKSRLRKYPEAGPLLRCAASSSQPESSHAATGYHRPLPGVPIRVPAPDQSGNGKGLHRRRTNRQSRQSGH